MKNLAITLALLVAMAGVASFVSFRMTGDAGVKAALAKRDALEWLRTEFSLTDAQYSKIKQLHASYSLECEDHCRAIQEAMRARNALKAAASSDAATLASAEKRVAELRRVCETAIAGHVRRCAAEMSPRAAERYLALVLPKIADFDHAAAPDVRLNPHAH